VEIGVTSLIDAIVKLEKDINLPTNLREQGVSKDVLKIIENLY
jgi:alcohol dehydrogenase class IV